MTRDDIIRMAQEANLWITSDERRAAVVRFAHLVAAAERSACAKVAELVAREIDDTNGTASYIVAAIRARGEK